MAEPTTDDEIVDIAVRYGEGEFSDAELVRRVRGLQEFTRDVGVTGWQPIATAPTDGRLILLYPSRCWCDEVNSDCEVGYWDADTKDWESSTGTRADDYHGPTHWMSLPDPPVVGDGEPR